MDLRRKETGSKFCRDIQSIITIGDINNENGEFNAILYIKQ